MHRQGAESEFTHHCLSAVRIKLENGKLQEKASAGIAHFHLLLAEEDGRPRPPQQLAEAVFAVLLQQTALEGPQPVGIVHLWRAKTGLGR